MKEQDVWQLASELWEKREKIEGFDGISVVNLEYYNEWGIDISGNFFTLKETVRRFLDGLDKPKEKQLGYKPANPYQDGLE